ncbi:peptidoglycan DD-metalloendopeptidase family protein [Roseofilum sp. BLCC_M91]|uniref:Peptidoglycan DD-metalloendopeptidase family protein n=1 Tax=Roseofilum halophilum BLCC-M91 TaxID=3022259 RepID=A0ABT7BL70_9CYAN|nr:M23 family metallopeptidase [Roseofilum halophilum]MDJ1179920.1 peptidoglycan DD-metalloendopeptidase family protein [Roseofilum halophilum BLCC-M91]
MELSKSVEFAGVRQRFLTLLFAVWMMVCLWLSLSAIAQASPSIDRLQKQQEQLEQDQKLISEEQERLKNLEQAAQEHLKGVKSTLQLTDRQLKGIEDRIEETTTNLDRLQGELDTQEQEYQDLAQGAIARFQFLQRQPRHSGLSVLLQSETLTDFLSRRHRLKQLALADRQLLLTVKTALDETQQQALEVEQTYNDLLLMRQQLVNQKSDYQTQSQVQTQLIERLNTDREALEAAYLQLQKDSEGIEALIRQRLQTDSLSLRKILKLKPGKMLTPSYGEFSSNFGWRTHPIFGYQRFHAGMDFAAEYGSPIYAAQNGVVLFAGWYGGYGNTVILDHGNGVTTLYAHASQVYVQEGQNVTQGDAIATTGSTGLSTGPHLHFEVRENGTPVDPMNYLT